MLWAYSLALAKGEIQSPLGCILNSTRSLVVKASICGAKDPAISSATRFALPFYRNVQLM